MSVESEEMDSDLSTCDSHEENNRIMKNEIEMSGGDTIVSAENPATTAANDSSDCEDISTSIETSNNFVLKDTASVTSVSEMCDSNYGSLQLDSFVSNLSTEETFQNSHAGDSPGSEIVSILSGAESVQDVTDNAYSYESNSEKTVTHDDSHLNLSDDLKMFKKEKTEIIMNALEANCKSDLIAAALSEGGLLNDDLRKKVWPILANVHITETVPRPTMEEIKAHPYYDQVVMDVNRSLKRFPPSIKEAQKLTMLDQLVFLIMRVLCQHPELHYYQGYHDICITFLLVLGEEVAYHVVEKLSLTHLHVFMEKDMAPTIHLLEYMYLIIGKRNVILKTFLSSSEVGIAYCLSWLITWFGHVLNEYDNVIRLFDFFIVSDPWMPMYLTTAIVLHREKEILQQECDMASVHSLLSNIPENLPFEDLLEEALKLFDEYKPKALAKERPYVKKNKVQKRSVWGLIQFVAKTVKHSKFTLPIMVAATAIITAAIYQTYKF